MTEKTTGERIREMSDEELVEERARVSAQMLLDKGDFEATRLVDGTYPLEVEREFLVKRSRMVSFVVRLEGELTKRRLPAMKALVLMNAHMLKALDNAALYIRGELRMSGAADEALRVIDEAREKARANTEVQAAAERFA